MKRYITTQGREWWYTASIAAFTVCSLVYAHTQSITWLGTGSLGLSRAYSVSNEAAIAGLVGSVGGGGGFGGPYRSYAFYWAGGTMQEIVVDANTNLEARGIANNQRVVVGFLSPVGSFSVPRQAFRWTPSTGIQDIGSLGGNYTEAHAVSADGSVIVGVSRYPSGFHRAFRWRAAGGMQDIGTLGGNESWAYSTSADGRVIVGWAQNASGQIRAFRWAFGSGMQDLGTFGGLSAIAYAVSANGSVVVGASFTDQYTNNPARAFRWENGVMEELAPPAGYNRVVPYGVSGDGTLIVGAMNHPSLGARAFRWTPNRGVQDLNEVYAAWLPTGSVLREARGVSPDGRYIVGWGRNIITGRDEAFLLDTQC